MTSLQQLYIAGSDLGLQTNKKPWLLQDKAFSRLMNAYVYRDRVQKRQGLELLGRLTRHLTAQSQANADGTGSYSIADLLTSFRATEPNAELETESVVLTFDPGGGNETSFTDNGLGEFTRTSGTAYDITASSINYITGAISLTWDAGGTPAAGITVEADFNYFPMLPVMGISDREIATINEEQEIFFDTRYAYINSGSGFQEFIAGTTWTGSNSDFFWTTNYRGTNPQDRIFFATNNKVASTDPIRYVSTAGAWIDFAPVIDSTPHYFVQARVLIPYYGRLVALNVWEAPDTGAGAPDYASAVNIFNRARFSQIGNPLDVDAWRQDQFGRGGFIDAPTNEAITGAIFYKNTLIVRFERTTWQLRYVGEYGLPFIWERISSDFGSESTFSDILFDEGVLSIGDKAITVATSFATQRIDLEIPDTVFQFRNNREGKERIHGIRDFQRELVYWCFCDGNLTQGNDTPLYPQYSLVYNYRNKTYAIFRNSVTCFGTYQPPQGITWDSLTVTWDDYDVFWDDVNDEALFPRIVSGNQHGYVHYYGYTTQDEPSLTITAVDLTVSPNELTIPNHNLLDAETIYLTGLLFDDDPDESLNDRLFSVQVIDIDTIAILYYNGDLTPPQYVNTPTQTPVTYLGNGKITLFPKLDIQTKDFNPYQDKGLQTKISYIDFLTDATENAKISVQLFVNSSIASQANLLVGNTQVETDLPSPYYVPASEYSWHRFFATNGGQFIRIGITYDDELMNTLSTHQQDFVLNAMSLSVRPAGKTVF